MNSNDQLTKMVAAYQDGGFLRTEMTSIGTGIRIYRNGRKVGPIIFPGEHQTVGQAVDMFIEAAANHQEVGTS